MSDTDVWLVLAIVVFLVCIGVHTIGQRSRVVYIDVQERNSAVKEVAAWDGKSFDQIANEERSSVKIRVDLLDEDPKPGSWSKEETAKEGEGPPFFVYRDPETGKSVTAVRGSKMYNDIISGMKAR